MADIANALKYVLTDADGSPSSSQFNYDFNPTFDALPDNVPLALSSEYESNSYEQIGSARETDINQSSATYTSIQLDNIIGNVGFNYFKGDQQLLDLLQKIDEENHLLVYYSCIKKNVQLNHLQYLKPRHIELLLSPSTNLGAMAMFEEKLLNWQNKQSNAIILSNEKRRENTNEFLEIVKRDRILAAKFEKQQLSDGEVKRLLTHIVAHYIENAKKLSNDDMEALSIQIELSFPGELKSTYFHKNAGGNPTGKLYNKWHNRLKDLEEDLTAKQIPETKDTSPVVGVGFNETEMEKTRLWLSNYSEPIQEIIEKWHITTEYRKTFLDKQTDAKDISNLFADWPLYKSTRGPVLIGIDFKYAFPSVEENLFSRWNLFKSKISSIFGKDIKDPVFLSDWNDFAKFECNEDTLNACLIYLLPAILRPCGRNQATIAESQSSLIQYTTDPKNIQIGDKKEPFLICIGKNKFDIQKVVAYFDGVYYLCNTLLHGLEMCYKIYSVFNVKYPKAANNVWVFIQTFFYNMSFPTQRINPNVYRLISKIEK